MNHLFSFLKELDINIFRFVKKHFLCFLPSILFSVCSIVYPSFIQLIIDDGISKNNKSLTFLYTFAMLFIGMLIVCSSYFARIMYSKFNTEFVLETKNKIFTRFLLTDNNFYINEKSGNLYTILNSDLPHIGTLLIVKLPQLITSFITFIGISFFIVYYFHFFGVIIIFLSLSITLVHRIFAVKIETSSKKMREYSGKEASYSTEALTNLENIKMSGHISYIKSNYLDVTNLSKDSFISFERLLALSNAFSLSLSTIIMIIILLIGAFQINAGNMEVGVLFSLTIYAQRVSGPITSIIQTGLDIKTLQPILSNIQNILKLTVNSEKDLLTPNEVLNSISFDELTFSYQTHANSVLQNFNLLVEKGSVIGITGHNGSGKTTLIKLLLKICKTENGRIILNKKYNLNDISSTYLNQNISYLPQSNYLMSGTLREILDPLKIGISDENIMKAMSMVNINFELFNCSLDSDISENANNISGGEKQKIALARLILENRPILILDEPTSAMDSESEKIFCSSLSQILKDKTGIIITHRPEILKVCSNLVEL